MNLRITDSHSRVLRSKERSVRILAGFGAGASYGVHSDTLQNLARGIVERVFNVQNGSGLARPPQPKRNVFRRLSVLRTRLLKKLSPTPLVAVEDYPTLYTGRKQQLYQRAVDSLMVREVSPRDATVSTFVKAEKVNFTKKVDPAPRVIQPRSPRYNVMVGRYLKLFESELCKGFERLCGSPVVLKGRNADQVGHVLHEHWQAFTRPAAVGLDASRFDQHVSRAALEWEHSVYNAVFRSKELRRLLKWQLSNCGIARVEGKRVDYQVDGCRMSGDINTGMGNCLIMSSIVIAYCWHAGLKFRLANNGDDCVLFVERSDLGLLDGLDQWFLDFGFTLTREDPAFILEHVEFCQAHPVCIGGFYRMVRDIRTAPSKDVVSLLGWDTPSDIAAWAHAISSCGLSLTSGVPVWEEFYMALNRIGEQRQAAIEHVAESGMSYMSKGVRKCGLDDGARYSFYLAFGILPDLQEALEDWYRHSQISCDSPRPMTYSQVRCIDIQTNPLSQWLNAIALPQCRAV